MDFIYYLFTVIVMVIVAILTIGLIRPRWVAGFYKLVGKTNFGRKFVAATMIPAMLLSGTILSATEPASVKLERQQREVAELQTKKDASADKQREQQKDAELAKQKAASEEALRAQAAKEAADKKVAAEAKVLADEAEAAQRAEADRQAAASRTFVATPTPQPPASAPTPTPTPSYGVVHPGSFCSSNGAQAVFSSGNPAICAIDSKGQRLRWQSP